MALLLAVAWHLRWPNQHEKYQDPRIEIPKRTYVSVPQSIIHAGGRPTFRDEDWSGEYQLKPLKVYDSARWFSGGMYQHFGAGAFVCVSFHWSKTLGLQQGGAILHSDQTADMWFRRARFDGRQEGIPPHMDDFDMVGWHAYMSPEIAALGLMKLSLLPKHNKPLPNDQYPDLSLHKAFQ
jgi:dTDP-4-amino-4,6-dideoxygalactose transaminase